MKKIILMALFFSFSVWAGASDNIILSSEISPACDVQFSAEPIASNLDLVNSQTDLLLGRATVSENTSLSSLYQSNLSFDLADHLTHSTNSSYIFSFDHLKVINQDATAYDPFPMGSFSVNDFGNGYGDFYISYVGVPALTLVQGTYTATWYVSCSVEPRI